MTAAITATLYDEDGAGTGTVLANASGKSFLVERNATGTGTLRLPITDDDAALLDYDKVVVFTYAAQETRAWVIETLDWNVVDEAGSRYVLAAGRGIEMWLEGAAVYPVGGMKRKSATERFFNFASVDSYDHDLGATWVVPGAIPWDDRVGPLAGYPLDWPDIQCRWIWAGAPYELVPANTPNWFRRRFTLTARYPVRVFATADSGADVYLDGEQVLSFTHNETGQWRKTFTADITLEAGTHVLAIEGRNGTNPTTPTPAGVIALLTTLTADGDPDATILRTSTQARVSTTEPGWLAGDVLHTLVTEAQARGAGRVANLTLDFDAELDSNGDPWTVRVNRSWKVVFDNVLTVASDLAELGIDFWITPDLVMHAAEARGEVTSVTLKRGQDAGDPSVQAWSVSGQRATATHAWILTAKGWVEASDTAGVTAHGRLEVGYEVGNTPSDDTADEVAAAAFAAAAAPTETVKATALIPAEGAVAFVDFGIGDVVNGWDRNGDAAQVRVLSITLTEDDDDGKVTYTPEFDVYDAARARPFPPRTPSQSLAVAVKKAFPGAGGGKIRSVGAGQGQSSTATAAGLVTGGGPGSGGTAVPLIAWAYDEFEVDSTNLGPFTLSYRPLNLSEDVKVNGAGIDRDSWTRNDTTITVDADVFAGLDDAAPWQLTVHYQHSGVTGSPTDAPDTGAGSFVPTEWRLNGDAYVAGEYWTLTEDGVGDAASSMVSVDAMPAGWTSLTMRVEVDLEYTPGEQGDGFTFGLLDSTEHPDTFLGGSGGSRGFYPATDAVYCIADINTYSAGAAAGMVSQIDDLTTAEAGVFGGYHAVGLNTYELTLAKTTSGRATGSLRWNGALVVESIDDLYVPDSPRFIVTAGTGGFVQGAQVRSVTIEATSDSEVPDPDTYEPGGTYTPPTPVPPTPVTPDLSWAPISSSWVEREIDPAGETITIPQDEDWHLEATEVVTGPVTIVGGGNLKIIGLIGEQSTSVPSSGYDAERRGLRFKDGPNPNIARSIHCEGIWFREGYYSDPIQLAFRTENAVTFILQNLRVDAVVYGGNTDGLVHADLVQFWGGPRTFLSDGVTAKHLTYQGAYLDPGDKRALPAGPGLDWVIRRWNLEEDDMNGGAHYLLADRRPAFSRLTCDEVYVMGGKNVNDTFGRFPTAGVHRNATPPGGDFVPDTLWTGDVYTSPGYV